MRLTDSKKGVLRMKKMFSSSLIAVAGMVSAPVATSPRMADSHPAPEYRNDPRLASIRVFFEKFDCPAWKYATVFLEAADAYDLDWRLLPSLSYVESTGGKAARNNNLFGWDSGRASFPSPTAGIHAVGYHLSHSVLYRDKNLDEILATYNPQAEYAAKVKSVMQRISALSDPGGSTPAFGRRNTGRRTESTKERQSTPSGPSARWN
ncbi:MAG TPA: hypothetical protein VE959_07015 [Bryobacteraceae bacterium]|nr:hypothetical protein [Bryobacteraceae bacterium]